MTFQNDSKIKEMLNYLNKSPHDFNFNGENLISIIGKDIRIAIPSGFPRLEIAAQDFKDFLSKSGRINAFVKKITAEEKSNGFIINISDTDKNDDSYNIILQDNVLTIIGNSEMGAVQGLYYTERLLVKYNGLLPENLKIERKTSLKRRITTTAFNPPIGWPEDNAYLDGYLSRMSHFGYNGIFITDKFFTYALSEAIPELNASDRDKVIDYLNNLTEKADKYGIGLYLIPSMIISPNSSVFQNHPELKGAKFWEGSHCLCSSSPVVLQFYKEVVANLVKDVPLLKGLILIIGGECFLHCYTRAIGKEKTTSCPRCVNEDPVKLVSRQVRAVLDGASGKIDIIVWPYSAFYWYRGDNDYLDLIKALPEGIAVMESPSKDSPLTRQGVTAPAFDCDISVTGPSERFRRIAKTVKEKSFDLIAKTDSSSTIEAYSIPYIPVLGRWYERHSELAKIGIDGMLGCWHINGFTGTMSDELAYECMWSPLKDKKECLSEIAQKFFGKNSIKYCIDAWESFNKAWDYFPFSAAMTGLPYFRGPFHFGPAHPLVLDVQNESKLPGDFFHKQNVDNEFCDDEEKLKEINKTPMFFSDLIWTLPYGYISFENALLQTLKFWNEGLMHYSKAIEKADNKEIAHTEYGVADMFKCILTTAYNVLRFQKLKIKLYEGVKNPQELEKIINSFVQVAKEELENAKNAIKLANEDIRIGYGGYTYKWFTPEIIEKKIKLTRNLIEKEIPDFAYLLYTVLFGIVR
jgi:hypothetical protein